MAYRRTPREFRPAKPKPRDFLGTAFLGLLLAILLPSVLARPKLWDVVGTAGTLLLVAGGLWLQLRGRWPGDPMLKVGREGMSYVRSGRVRSLTWKDIAAIEVDFTLNRMSFVPVAGKPIRMRENMVAADGTAWLMVIEDYWSPPRQARTCC